MAERLAPFSYALSCSLSRLKQHCVFDSGLGSWRENEESGRRAVMRAVLYRHLRTQTLFSFCLTSLLLSLRSAHCFGFAPLLQHPASLLRADATGLSSAAACSAFTSFSLGAHIGPKDATPVGVLGMLMQERRGGRGGGGRGGRTSFRGAGGGRGRGTSAGRGGGGGGPSWGEDEELGGGSSKRPDFARMRKDSNRETVHPPVHFQTPFVMADSLLFWQDACTCHCLRECHALTIVLS